MRRYQNKKHFKIRKRAVVRTIDFLVSFTLFIILLTQFYLIIINMNLNLSTISTTEENPAQLFSEKILSSPGTKDWGILPGVPQNIGLAPDQTHSGFNYYLDLAKFAHLNSELQYLSINSSYSYISPSTLLSNLTGSQGNVQFRISTRPIMQVQVSEVLNSTSSVSNLTIKTRTWTNLSIPYVEINYYFVSLSTGNYFDVNTTSTGFDGNAFVSVPNIQTDNYIVVIFAHSKDSWGINWITVQNNNGTINSTDINSFNMNNPIIDNNSILQYSSSTNGLNIATATAFYSSFNNTMFYYSNTTGASQINTILTNVGTDAPFIQVYTMYNPVTSNYYYRVVTQPLIFDNYNYISPTNANYSTSQFPVYQTPNFQNTNSGTIYTYSTPVMTQRGPILFTVDYSSS